MRTSIRKILRACGLDVVSYDPVNHPTARRCKLMERNKIDLVFDVGANAGQYGARIRAEGYKGRIVSFEPLNSAFSELAKRSARDADWTAVNVALGDRSGVAEINISGNSQSSSLLGMLPSHVEAAPGSVYIGREEITISTLDAIFDDYWKAGDSVFLKIDAQGYERNIVEGAQKSLERVVGVQMELSLVPLYDGEALLAEMIDYMTDRGYVLMSVDPTYGNRETGQMLQADCMFFRQPR